MGILLSATAFVTLCGAVFIGFLFADELRKELGGHTARWADIGSGALLIAWLAASSVTALYTLAAIWIR